MSDNLDISIDIVFDEILGILHESHISESQFNKICRLIILIKLYQKMNNNGYTNIDWMAAHKDGYLEPIHYTIFPEQTKKFEI
jgi:hypothetical protein